MNDIDRIKDLLFGHEKKALDAITRRLETPESRTADIADVLPEAVLRSHASDRRLVRALEEPVEQCIKNSIRKDPRDFADALFPVIGPAIRKAIAEALRSMTQSLNQAIENSLSIKTRFQAWRAGVRLGEYILQRNVVYRVEQAFLIKRSDGLLIEHVHHEGAISRDTDAVSAMFTAIQDFIQHSFEEDTDENLTTAVLGDLTLWAVHGPRAILVCVIRGVPPAGLRNDLSAILEQIHLRYGEALREYRGGQEVVGLETELERCLLLEHLESQAQERGRPVAALVLLALLAALAAWWVVSSIAESRRVAHFREVLENTPGIVVTDLERDGGLVIVKGLRDPLSARPADLAPAARLEGSDLRFELEPYQSLDTPIIERRARRVLRPPPGVGLRLEGGVLHVTGSAPGAWKRHVQQLGPALPGVDRVDTSLMNRDDEELLEFARARLEPPPGVELAVSDGRIRVSGVAPAAWRDEAARRASGVAELARLSFDGLESLEGRELTRLVAAHDGTELLFARNDILARGQDAKLASLAAQIARMAELSRMLGARLQVTVTPHVDGIGTPALNDRVRAARAERVAAALTAAGMSRAALVIDEPADNAPTGPDPARRKVVVDITATPVPAS